MSNNTHLSLLLIEIVNNDTDEEIEGEEGSEYDEDDKVKVHVEVDFSDGLFLHLKINSFINQLVTLTCLEYRVLEIEHIYLLLLNLQLHALFPSIL